MDKRKRVWIIDIDEISEHTDFLLFDRNIIMQDMSDVMMTSAMVSAAATNHLLDWTSSVSTSFSHSGSACKFKVIVDSEDLRPNDKGASRGPIDALEIGSNWQDMLNMRNRNNKVENLSESNSSDDENN